MADPARILVVEDDPRIAEVVAGSLRQTGYRVSVAGDGLTALRAFDHTPPALVTLDLTLPALSGFRLLHLFKRDRPQTPVLVVSGMAFEEAEEVAHARADDFLTKPFELKVLLEKVAFHLCRSRPGATPASPTLPPLGLAADPRPAQDQDGSIGPLVDATRPGVSRADPAWAKGVMTTAHRSIMRLGTRGARSRIPHA